MAAAALLGKDGFNVTVLEKNPFLGGRARVFRQNGFTLDAGPSWYLMPEVFERYFQLFGTIPAEFYQLVPLNPGYRVFFENGDHVDLTTDESSNAAVFESLQTGGGQAFHRYMVQAAYKYRVAMSDFLYHDYRKITEFLNRRLMTEGVKLNVFQNLDRFVGRYFTNEKARQILEYSMVFLGTSPYDTPALYSMMSHADLHDGVWYPQGGFSTLVNALVTLGTRYGVTYRTETQVTAIRTMNGTVQGLALASGEYVEADIVLSNADYHFTETQLLADTDRSYGQRYWNRRDWAPAMFKFCYALDTRVQNLAHHNLYFPDNWKEHFDSMFRQPSWPARPAFYLGSPSQTDRSLVPAQEADILFFLVPIAAGLDDNQERRLEYRAKVLERFKQLTGNSLDGHIVFEQICTVSDCARFFNAYRGTALGLAHTLRQTAVFRPRMYSRAVRGLYYTGQMTQPGIGLPMVMISGELAARAIHNDAVT